MLLWALLGCAALAPTALSAQVGYDPAHSPFRDVPTGQSITPFISQFFGNQSKAGVGTRSGLELGARFGTTLSGPLDFWVTVGYIKSERFALDPSKPDSLRLTGPNAFPLVSADLSLALNLTGQKTFHGLAPYLAVGLGMIMPTSSVTDPGGFKAESHLSLVPTIGTRVRISRSASLTLEARDNLIQYEWPLAYFFPTDAAGNALPAVLDPLTEGKKQWTHNFTLTAGLSYHFSF
jgi:hypothetical protein